MPHRYSTNVCVKNDVTSMFKMCFLHAVHFVIGNVTLCLKCITTFITMKVFHFRRSIILTERTSLVTLRNIDDVQKIQAINQTNMRQERGHEKGQGRGRGQGKGRKKGQGKHDREKNHTETRHGKKDTETGLETGQIRKHRTAIKQGIDPIDIDHGIDHIDIDRVTDHIDPTVKIVDRKLESHIIKSDCL